MVVSLTLLAVVSPLLATEPCPELGATLQALDAPARCLTPAIRAAWLRAETPRQLACVQAAMRDRGLPEQPMAAGSGVQASRALLPELTVADPYGAPNQLTSEHFVVLWDSDDGLHESWITNLIGAFEDGWDNHVDGWGMPTPTFMQEHYFNVYLGNTGDGIPSISGASGYFTTDGDGNPMIVIDPDILSYGEYASTTAVHEFFHACEWATGNYVTYDSMWFWEASATWSEGETYIDSQDYAWPLPGFAYYGHLPLTHFDYPDTGTLVEMHHYGAFIWPRFVGEHVADPETTIEVWLEGSAGGDPLYHYGTLLGQSTGREFEDIWGDFLAHNAVWDYLDHDLYEEIIGYYESWYDDRSLAGSYSAGGMEEALRPRDYPPHNLGANYVQLLEPAAGPLRFQFEGDNRGSEDSLSEWEIRLVLEKDGAWEYVDLEVEDRLVDYTGDDVSQYDAVYVSIGAWAATTYDDESFSYSYRLWVEGAFPDTGLPEDTGSGPKRPDRCGCSASAPAAGVVWFGIAGLALVRRTRPDVRAVSRPRRPGRC